MNINDDICLPVSNREQNYDYYLILIDTDLSDDLTYHTYNIPVDKNHSKEEVDEIAYKFFDVLPNAFNKHILKINKYTYVTYYRIAKLENLLYYLPNLRYVEKGRDFILERKVENKRDKLFKELEIDSKMNTILELEGNHWKWC